MWAVAVIRGPVPSWADWASTGVDLLAIVALCVVSGGATAALLPVFFLLPISVAFGDRPVLTAIFGIGTAVGYLAVWIVYAKRDPNVELPKMVFMHVGFLMWLAVATTALWFRAGVAIGPGAGSPRGAAPTGVGGVASRRASQPGAGRAPDDAPCRRSWRPGWNSTRFVNAIPIPPWTWSTRHCRSSSLACARRSRRCIRRCSPNSVSPQLCEN